MPKYEQLTTEDVLHLMEFPDTMKRSKLLVIKMLRIIDQMETQIRWLERQLNCPAHGHLCADARCDIRDEVSVNTKKVE